MSIIVELTMAINLTTAFCRVSTLQKYGGPEVTFSQPDFHKVNPHLLLDKCSKWVEFSNL